MDLVLEMVVNLSNLLLETSLEIDGLVFTNNYVLRENFYDSPTQISVGLINSRFDRKNGFVYHQSKFKEDEPNKKYKSLNKRTNAVIDDLLSFLDMLWIVTDNSIGITTFNSKIATKTIGYNGNLCSYPSNCSGKREDKLITVENLKNATEIWKKYKTFKNIDSNTEGNSNARERTETVLYESDDAFVRSILHTNTVNFDYNETNCLEKAFYFLALARTTEYLIFKVALYVPILECLFSNDKDEVTTKVSMRVAFYMGKSPKERKDIAKEVRQIYNIRSRFLHGQNFTSDDKKKVLPKIDEICKKTDQLIRDCLYKAIMIDSEKFLDKGQIREDFLTELIFDDYGKGDEQEIE